MSNLVVDLEDVAVQQEAISLQTLVGRLVAGALPKAVRNGSFLINDVPENIRLVSNPDLVSTVLSNLLLTMATHTANSCIRVTASTLGIIVTVQLRDAHSGHTYTIASSLQSMQPIAEKIGGYLGITSQEKNDTTVIFSFPNA